MPSNEPLAQSTIAPLLKPDAVCRLLQISRRTLATLVASGGLPYLRIGGQLRFDEADLRAWIVRQRGGVQ